ncbi:hypothetical protein D1BOALGB6SA_1531 [Olavius sp. associated proteobacterium Delta 1]|nr:hypothetical protein D1BOALGB6SA_1531 [Olavius sp. associated proteobacterium Delta 1]
MKLIKILSLSLRASLLIFAVLFPWDQALAQQRGYGDWSMGPGMMGNRHGKTARGMYAIGG